MSDPEALGQTLATFNAVLNTLRAAFSLAVYGFANPHKPAAHKR